MAEAKKAIQDKVNKINDNIKELNEYCKNASDEDIEKARATMTEELKELDSIIKENKDLGFKISADKMSVEGSDGYKATMNMTDFQNWLKK